MVPTDLVAMTVETFTARRAYRSRRAIARVGMPVVMGGHHPSMLPEEALAARRRGGGRRRRRRLGAGRWPTPRPVGCSGSIARTPGQGGAPVYDRSIFAGKRYAPISLVQVGRGCRFACDFCSIHAFYGSYRDQRDPADVVAEMRTLPRRRLVFFVDDNLYWRRDAFVAPDAGA